MSKQQEVTLTLDVPDGYAFERFALPVTNDIVLLAQEPGPEYWRARWYAHNPCVILRKLPSPTVMVELERAGAEWLSSTFYGKGETTQDRAGRACRAALEAEAQP